MDAYASEKEQIESLKKWWRENALALIIGAVIGLGGLFGWRYWQQYQDSRSEEASVRYERFFGAVQAERYEEAQKLGAALVDEYGDTPYATLGALMLARVMVLQGDAAGAEQQLRWVLEQGVDAESRVIARLRLARLLLGEGEIAQVEALLQATTPTAFEAVFDEIRGDLLLAKGDRDGAREAYRRALNGEPQNAAQIQLKLDDIGIPDSEAVQ